MKPVFLRECKSAYHTIEILVSFAAAAKDTGRFPFDRNFRNQGKIPKIRKLLDFRKFWKFRDESQMERKFPGKYV